MSRPFAKYPGKPTFGVFKKKQNASDYILNKKNKYIFNNCNNYCKGKKIFSQTQGNYLLSLKCLREETTNIDKTQLYINLFTKLYIDNNIPVISDLSNNTYPTTIDINDIPYLTYNIDPSGYLFGNNICGLMNFERYLIPNIL